VGSFINRGPTSAGIMQGFGPGNPSSPVGNNPKRKGQSMYRFAGDPALGPGRGPMSGTGLATKFNPSNAYYNDMINQAITAGTVAVTPDGTGLMYRQDGTPINSASETMTSGQQAIANNQNQGPYSLNYKKEDARPPPTGIEAIDVLGQRLNYPNARFGLNPDGTLMASNTFTVPTGGTGVINEPEEKPEENNIFNNIAGAVTSIGSRVEAFSKMAGFDFGSLQDAYNWAKENVPNLLDTNFTPEEVIQFDAVNSQKVTLPGTVTGVGNIGDPLPADTTAGESGGLYDIPSLTAIRSAVPGTYDPTRRPGSGGQRYFSDIQYVNNVEDPTAQRAANLAAQGRTDRQALGLAALNAANPAFQTRPSSQTLTDAQVFDMFTQMGQNPNLTTERQQIEQAVGMMNRYNVSPERLSEIMNVPLADIRERMGAYYTPYGEETDTYQSIKDLISNSTSARPKENRVTTQQDKVDSIVAGMTPTAPVTPVTPVTPATPVATPGFTLPDVRIGGGFDPLTGGFSTFGRGEYSQADIDTVLAGLANGDTTIDELSTIYGTPALDILENTILDQGRTPAQAAALGGITEEDLVTQLINAGKTNPAEVLAYYQANTPEGEDFSNTTVTDVENYLNRNLLFEPDATTGEYAAGDVNAVINALQNDSVEVEDLSNLYGIPADDILANLASMGFGPDGEFIPLAQGGEIDQYYLGGSTDGMADDIPAMIGNSQPAALSDGEFVIPADVVSHLGNGNSDAGAQNLYSMMDRVRKDRTGNPNQGKQIDPNQYLA